MHRRADHQAVAVLHPLKRRVHQVISEHTALPAAARTAAAADAAAHGAPTDVQDLALNAAFRERRGDLAERFVRAAALVRAAVDEKNLHI